MNLPASSGEGSQRLPWIWVPDRREEEVDRRREIFGRSDQVEESMAIVAEREHMFDKVVTPSDVGKLNRLVIPKQHAEKYFPLDSATNEKGLLLNFEDRTGKAWRFRYSYWNSSQSYVMTKGWSRFVKEKKLDAGDTVSFHRGVGEIYKGLLYIDWRPRHVLPSMAIPHHLLRRSLPWAPVFLRPQTLLPTTQWNYQPIFQQKVVHNHGGGFLYRCGSNSHHSPPYPQPIETVQVQTGRRSQNMAMDTDIGNGNSVPKRFRLFGVNMECSNPEENSGSEIENSTSLFHHSQFKNKGKGSPSTLDFNILGCEEDDDEDNHRPALEAWSV